VSIHRQKAVPRLKPAVLRPVARLRTAVHRDPKSLDRGVEDQKDQQTGEEIHCRSSGQHHQLLPGRRVAKGPGIGGLLILPLHSAEAANRQSTETVKCFPFLFLQKSRSHANGKFIDLDPKQLCGGKMAELMDRDEQSKHKDS
jgi:hypothetical protein